ncbi:MAG: hypothetical protein HRU20_30940 [Pseudomonadales bacterium]|nr:hypothetical protein [Pseudomonadales bacterium]
MTTAVGLSDDYAKSVNYFPNGSLIVAGNSSNGSNSDFALALYHRDGSLDARFTGDNGAATGTRTAGLAEEVELAYTSIIQADGKPVFIGIKDDLINDKDFLIMRFNIDGSLDTQRFSPKKDENGSTSTATNTATSTSTSTGTNTDTGETSY